MARRQCVLRHDFGGGEIALEAEPAGLAEDASARAAHLRGDADRPALAGTEGGDRLMDEHGLDHLAVIEPHREADGPVGIRDDLGGRPRNRPRGPWTRLPGVRPRASSTPCSRLPAKTA